MPRSAAHASSIMMSGRVERSSGAMGDSGTLPSSISFMKSSPTLSSFSRTPSCGPLSLPESSRQSAPALISQISCVIAAWRFLLKIEVSFLARSSALSVAAFMAVMREDSSEACASKSSDRSCEFKYSGSMVLRMVSGGWSKMTSGSMSLALAAFTLVFSTLSFPSSVVILNVSSSGSSMPVADKGSTVRRVTSFFSRLKNFP
mmetsp:Transcript_129467/g.314511  ORF Transcript_129467/g.314511 Transcript_129467/m.314511 type:complete len:203 (+) Transcript_129467:63-671(+)